MFLMTEFRETLAAFGKSLRRLNCIQRQGAEIFALQFKSVMYSRDCSSLVSGQEKQNTPLSRKILQR